MTLTASPSPPGIAGASVDPLLSESALTARLDALAVEINATYAGSQRLILIGVLKGSFMFLSDLAKRLTVPCQIEFIRLASYGGGTTSSGQVKAVDLSLPSLEGQDVLIVEDIVDTGLTLNFLLQYLESLHQTRSLRVAVLLDKPAARHANLKGRVKVDFTGFEIGNQFVVGYGLDHDGLYRNLPYVGVLNLPEASL